MKPVRFSRHASEQALRRGAALSDVLRAIREAPWERAERERFKATKMFPDDRVSPMNGVFYRFQTIEAIFTEETSEIIVVTVKVYYSNLERQP